MLQFSCRFAIFINCSSLIPDTENNANFDPISSNSIRSLSMSINLDFDYV